MTDIDVILPTFNRPGPLVHCLRALAGVAGSERLHVIVVDDGSDMPAEDAVPADLRDRLSIQFLRIANGGPAAARNAGLSVTTAPLVAFVDDDVWVDPGWLSAFDEEMKDAGPRTVCIGPLRAPANWKATPWNRWEAATLAVEYQRMVDHVYEPTWRQFFTGNALVPRALLQEAGPFNRQFTRAEDIELAARMEELGADFRFVPGAIGWHYAYRTLKSWQAIPKAYGHFDVEIDSLHPSLQHADCILEELAGRRGGIIRMLSTGSFRVPFTKALTIGGALTGRLGIQRLSRPMLSLAYDADYRHAFTNSLRERNESGTREQPINSASTDAAYARTQ